MSWLVDIALGRRATQYAGTYVQSTSVRARVPTRSSTLTKLYNTKDHSDSVGAAAADVVWVAARGTTVENLALHVVHHVVQSCVDVPQLR